MEIAKGNAAILTGALNEQELIIYNLERMAELIKDGNPVEVVLQLETDKWKERHKFTLEQAAMVIT